MEIYILRIFRVHDKWEIKFCTPNNIKTAKMHRLSVYLQKKKVPLNCSLGTVSHSI